MKKITLFFLTLFLVLNVNAQCNNTNQNPSFAYVATNDGGVRPLGNFFKSGEYTRLNGLEIGSLAEFNFGISGSPPIHGYITVEDYATGTVLKHGSSPLSWIITSSSVVLNWSNNNSCNSDTVNHFATYQILPFSCLNTTQYPSGNIMAINNDNEQIIAYDNYSGEFSTLTGLIIGGNTQFSNKLNSDNSDKYITIIDNNDGTTLLAEGVSPLNWVVTTPDIQLHWTNDATCSTDSENHTTSYRSNAPECLGTFKWPTNDITAVNNGIKQTIDTENYSGDYSVLNNLTLGKNYDFEVIKNNDSSQGYITIVDNTNGTTVLASGNSPLTWLATNTDIQLHWNNDSTCATDTENHTTTYLCRLPPINDTCSTATPISCGFTINSSTVNASDTTGSGIKDVWYSYTGNGTPESINLSLCGPGTNFDTTLRVTDSCDLNNNNVIAYNNNGCSNNNGASEVSFYSNGTSTYYILIEGYSSSDEGDFEMQVTCSLPLANDTCETSTPINCNTNISGSTINAVDTTGNRRKDVWYSYTGNGTPESINLSLCGPGTNFDTTLRVTDSCDLNNNNVIAYNNNGCSNNNGASEVSFYSNGTSTYYILIEGYSSSDEGDFEMQVTCSIPLANDTCETSTPINCNTNISGSTINAADTTGDGSNDVWYSYTGNGTPESINLSLCGPGTNFDTTLRVTDSCDLNNNNVIAYNNNGCSNNNGASEVSFYSNGTSTYYILIQGFASNEGDFEMQVTCSLPLANDTCETSTPINCNTIISGSTVNAVDTTGDGSKDVWYSYTGNGTPESINLSLCGPGTNFDTTLSVTDSCDLNNNNVIANDDDGCSNNNRASEVSFFSNGTSTYYILIEGFASNEGDFEMTINCSPINEVLVSTKVFLQGPLLNQSNQNLMNDNLRVGGLLPTTSPYGDGATVDGSIFNNNTHPFFDIVDWVSLELRNPNNPSLLLAKKSVLLARDGYVVDLNDNSDTNISFIPTQFFSSYHIAIKHRNHIGVISEYPINLDLDTNKITFDFTNNLSNVMGNDNARAQLSSGEMALWAGNLNSDSATRYLGPNNDISSLKDAVINNSGNTTNSNYFPFTGYYNEDINMNGQIRYLGPNNDSSILKNIILNHPDNTTSSNYFPIQSQIP